MKRKGFTLVEMLIVVAVLVTLMTITFKLSSLGGESDRRNRTIMRMQRLENCLSGYYAAFGSYPPVRLHGSRDIYQRVSGHGIQSDSERNESIWGWNKIGDVAEWEAWGQVRAACLSQPVDCRFPWPANYNRMIVAVSDGLKQRANSNKKHYENYWKDPKKKARLSAGFDDGSTDNIGRHAKNKNETEWSKIQLFRFGLMSFLLPRYMMMMNCNEMFFRDYAQWTGNNALPSDPFTGNEYTDWNQIRRNAMSKLGSDQARVANIPSQAVCARWMPNLQNICRCNHGFSFFGVDLATTDVSMLSIDNPDIEIFSPGGYEQDSTKDQYVLDGVTVQDGWWHDFYYYSPAPYQTYTLWSGGANNRTFPPWISRDKLTSQANRCVSLWTEDDIIRMSN